MFSVGLPDGMAFYQKLPRWSFHMVWMAFAHPALKIQKLG